MKIVKWILVAFWMCCALAAGAQTVRVESITGSGSYEQGARKHALARGQELPIGATINTGAQSLVMLRFEDGQTVALAENTSFQVSSFVFNAAQPKQGGSVLNLLRGGMRILTGALGKANPGSIRINTSTTSVGIRGSDIIVTMSINAGGVPQVTVQVVSGAASVAGTAVPVGSMAIATGTSVSLSVTVTVSSASALTGTAASLSSQLSVVNMTVTVSSTTGAAGAAASGTGSPVGTVQNLKGFATVTSPDGTIRLATQNMPLFAGDTVVTTAGSQLAVQFTASGCVAGVPGASMAAMAASATCRSFVATVQPVSMVTPSVAAAGGGAATGATATAGATAGTSVASTTAAGTTAAGTTAAGTTAAGTTAAGTTVAGTTAAGTTVAGTTVAGTTAAGGVVTGTAAAATGGIAGATGGAIAATTGVTTVAAGSTFSFVTVLGAGGGAGLLGIVGVTVAVNDKLQNASGA